MYDYFYGGVFPTLSDFKLALYKCTEGYNAMVLDKTVRSNKAEDCIFWYTPRAPGEIPSFRLCAPVFWKLDNRYRAVETGRSGDVDVPTVAEQMLINDQTKTNKNKEPAKVVLIE